ncbi:MAG: M20 family metallopeptidase [Chloroflexota bacterium]
METATAPGTGVTEPELAALTDTIRAAQPAFLADFERLVNIDCGSYTKDGVDEIGRYVAGFLSDLGAEVEARPDPSGRYGSTIVGRLRGTAGGPRVLLVGHMDTVFDAGTAAARPFRIDADGRAYGPGVSDMKGGLLAGLHAVRALAEPGPLPFELLTFIANPDEEVGSPTSTPHIVEAADGADVCLVLECARANGDIVSSRKGIVDARITVEGRAAHAGVEPEKGRNAILAAADVAQRLHALNGRWDGVTLNIGVVSGGTRPNVVPERCELQIDFRAVRRADLIAAEAAIREVLGITSVPDTTAAFTELFRWWPMEKLERSGRLVEHAIALAGRLGFELSDTSTGGASDANTTSGMGVPSLDGLGPIGGSDHAPGEYLEVDSIVPRTTLVACLLLAIARDPVVRGWRDDDRSA